MKNSKSLVKSLISILFFFSLMGLWAGCGQNSKSIQTQPQNPNPGQHQSEPPKSQNPSEPQKPNPPPSETKPLPPPVTNPESPIADPRPPTSLPKGRFVCETNVIASSVFHHLSTLAGDSYPFASLKFAYQGVALEKIYQPQLLEVSANHGTLYFQSLIKGLPVLMRSNVSWVSAEQTADKIIDLNPSPGFQTSSYQLLPSQNLIILSPAHNQGFELRSLADQRLIRRIQLPMTSKISTPSGNSDWVIFTDVNPKLNQIYAIHLKTGQSLTIQALSSLHTQISPWLSQDRLFWIEQDQNTTTLRYKNLATGQTLQINLEFKTLPFITGLTHENIQIFTVNSQGLGVIQLQTNAESLEVKPNIPFPAELQKISYFEHSMISQLISVENRKEVYLSLGNLGGLMKFKPETSSWSQVGIIASAYRCLNPTYLTEKQP